MPYFIKRQASHDALLRDIHLCRVPNEKVDIRQIISLPIQSIYPSTPMLEPP